MSPLLLGYLRKTSIVVSKVCVVVVVVFFFFFFWVTRDNGLDIRNQFVKSYALYIKGYKVFNYTDYQNTRYN